MNFIELAQWKEIPKRTRDELLMAAGGDILAQELVDLFPLFIDSPHWKQLPGEDRSELLLQSGKILYRYGYENDSVTYFEAAGTADPASGAPFLYLSLIQKKLGNGGRAKEFLERGLAGRVPEPDREYALGMTAFLDEDGDAAAAHFLAYLKFVPDDAFARYQAINLLIARYRFEEARELKEGFEEMYRNRISGIDAYMALTRREFGEARDAEAIWADLYANHPGRLDYLGNWGSALNAQGKFEYTIDLLSEPCQTTKDLRLATVLTEACFALELYEEVLKWVETGLGANPNQTLLLRFGAEAAEALGMYGEAKSYAGRFLSLNPDSSSQHSLYARGLMALDEWDNLRSHNLELLSGNMSSELALRNESEYAKAMYAKRLDEGKLRPYYLRMDRRVNRRLLSEYRQDPVNWSRYATAAAGDGYFHGAIPAIKYLYEMGPNQAAAILRYPQVSIGLPETGIPFERVREHIEALLAAGHPVARVNDIPRFIDPKRRNESPTPVPVVLLFSRADANALKNLDALLKKHKLTACLVIGEESLYPQTLVWPDKELLLKLQASGRWTFLLTDYAPPSLPRDASGRTGMFWGTPRWLGDRIESEEEVFFRLKKELSRLKNLAESSGISIAGWVYPAGNYGQLTIDSDTPANRAYRRAVSEIYTLGFASSASGFWAPHPDLWRLSARNIYLSTDTASLMRSLSVDQPTRQAVLDYAKILSWNGELRHADSLFRKAAEEVPNLNDVYYFHARNAQYEGDVPTALELMRKTLREDPNNPRTYQLERDVQALMSPELSVTPRYWEDSDGRNYYALQSRYSRFLNERTLLFGGVDFSRWSTGSESISGATPTLGFRRYVKPGHWFEVSAGLTAFDSGGVGSMFNFEALWHGSFHFKNLWNANGTYELSYRAGSIETLEAVRSGIYRHELSLSASMRVNHFWDVDARLYAVSYSDDNRTFGGSLRGLYRIWGRPLLRAGYLFEAADSRFNPPEYYAPAGYMHHAAVVDFRHYFARNAYINFFGTYGMARSETSDWHTVWRANFNVNWRTESGWSFSLGYRHLELPDYRLDSYQATITYRF